MLMMWNVWTGLALGFMFGLPTGLAICMSSHHADRNEGETYSTQDDN
jgi:hypothetical protein